MGSPRRRLVARGGLSGPPDWTGLPARGASPPSLRIPSICFLVRGLFAGIFLMSVGAPLAYGAGARQPTCAEPEDAQPQGCVVERDPSDDKAATDAKNDTGRKCPCPLRDEGEGEGEGEPEAADGGERGAAPLLRQIIPIVAAVIVIVGAIPLASTRRRQRLATVLLFVCALAAVGAYTDFGQWRGGRYVNGWEFFHYYLGSKYLDELGHTGLYEAAIVADVETGRQFSHKKDAIRNLSTGGCILVEKVLANADAIKARFEPGRWAEFREDVRYFKGTLSPWQWNGVFRDKGYNATPVWSMFVGQLSNRVETSQPLGLLLLSLIDPILLTLAVVAVWRAFEPRAALLMVILIGTHMVMSHSHMKGALVRTDWVAALVLALCALKCDRPVVGGVFCAYAAMSRVFPGLFAVALLAQPVVSLLTGEPRRRSQMRFAAGFFAALGVLSIGALAVIGPANCVDFARKIWLHNDSFSPWRMGFKHLFLGAYEYRAADALSHQEVFESRWVLWWAIQAVVLGACIYLSRRLANWEVLALGFIPTFFLVAPTYYYFIMLVVPFLFFAGTLRRPESALGVVCLFLSSNIAYFIYDSVGRELQLFYALSLMVLAVVLLMCFSALLRSGGWRIELTRSPIRSLPVRLSQSN